jgi:hypothetical protein
MFKKLMTCFTAAAFLAGCAVLMTCFTAAAFLAGCAVPRGEATLSAIDEALTEASLPAAAPADVQAALLPQVGVDLPDAAAADERFDVNTDSTPAKAF